MKHIDDIGRRRWLARAAAAASAVVLSGCDRVAGTAWFQKTLNAGESLTHKAQRLLIPRKAMAQEFTAADLSPDFRSNGTSEPNNPRYLTMASAGFTDYRLQVDGLVEQPMSFSLAELRALPDRTQITRHDCVEGWSAIAQWKGAKLASVLDAVKPKATARYVVFHCADPMENDGSSLYYESIDFDDAYHLQTILAYELNNKALPVANGAPIRLRVERQLGYKHAKYVMRIELVDSFDKIGGGKGGYWEDQGYQWYAGI